MASEVSKVSSLQAFWTSLEKKESSDEKRSSLGSRLIEGLAERTNWIVLNRGGLAYLTGLVMVPSQFLGPKAERSDAVISAVSKRDCRIERFEVAIGDTSLRGIICYPKNCNPQDNSRCILYHNPNGATVAGYLETGIFSWAPAEFQKLAHCPIILYDYRGTGLSSENVCSSSVAFRPTYETVVVDGEAALRHALILFKWVSVVGSSLGGGVATVSLDRHLKENPDDAARVTLLNHDSFSTTSRVVLPQFPVVVANLTGWVVGGQIDAASSIERLSQLKIPITVLCHERDPVIPSGARMADYVTQKLIGRNISVISSPQKGHANLSRDMVAALGKLKHF